MSSVAEKVSDKTDSLIIYSRQMIRRYESIKKFNSIHIDIEKGIYKINGESTEFISELKLEWNPIDGWALIISRDETYLAPIQRIKE